VAELRFVRIELRRGLQAIQVLRRLDDGTEEIATVPIPDDTAVTKVNECEYNFDPPINFDPWSPELVFRPIAATPPASSGP